MLLLSSSSDKEMSSLWESRFSSSSCRSLCCSFPSVKECFSCSLSASFASLWLISYLHFIDWVNMRLLSFIWDLLAALFTSRLLQPLLALLLSDFSSEFSLRTSANLRLVCLLGSFSQVRFIFPFFMTSSDAKSDYSGAFLSATAAGNLKGSSITFIKLALATSFGYYSTWFGKPR